MGWTTKNFAELTQGIAVIAAAVFFAWKWASGYMAFDMSVGATTRRFRRPGEKDLLVVNIALTKGDRESALLKSIKLYLSDPRDPSSAEEVEIVDANLKAADRAIRLTPGEATTFEHLIELPVDADVKVAAEVVATSGFFDLFNIEVKGYWRCTAISVSEEAVFEAKAKAA